MLRQMFDSPNINPKIPQNENSFRVKSNKVIIFFEKIQIRRHFPKVIFVLGTTTVIGCSGIVWNNHGDSCILISEKPPLRRVINYSDHELCGRKLSPRIAPNPKTRLQTE